MNLLLMILGFWRFIEIRQTTSELYFRAVWSRMAGTAEGAETVSDYEALYRNVLARPWPLGAGTSVLSEGGST